MLIDIMTHLNSKCSQRCKAREFELDHSEASNIDFMMFVLMISSKVNINQTMPRLANIYLIVVKGSTVMSWIQNNNLAEGRHCWKS